MKSIWKYQLLPVDRQELEMPEGAEILSVQAQREILCLWAIVDGDAAPKTRVIHVVGTGHNADRLDHVRYIGTAQMLGGGLVWHVFEEI